MNFTLDDNLKISYLKNIFGLLKNLTEIIRFDLKLDHIYIQGLDKSHICLYELKLYSDWFDKYNIEGNNSLTIAINLNTLYTIFNIHQSSQNLSVYYNTDTEKLGIQFVTVTEKKEDINKTFEIPSIDLDADFMDIPTTDYSLNFTISSKIFNDLIAQFSIFGDNLDIKSEKNQENQEQIVLSTSGDKCSMNSNINLEDLAEYEFDSDVIIDLTFGLKILSSIITSKISSNVNIYISNNIPIKIKYNLGNNSYLDFYAAPKVKDED